MVGFIPEQGARMMLDAGGESGSREWKGVVRWADCGAGRVVGLCHLKTVIAGSSVQGLRGSRSPERWSWMRKAQARGLIAQSLLKVWLFIIAVRSILGGRKQREGEGFCCSFVCFFLVPHAGRVGTSRHSTRSGDRLLIKYEIRTEQREKLLQ